MQPTSASSSSSGWSRKRRRNHVFRNGDRVEVRRNNDPSRWFKAVIVGSSRDMGGNILVEYLNSTTSGGFPGGKRQEYVPAGNVRPVPPMQLQRPCFKAGDPVDVLDANAWMQGEIVNVLLDKNNSATTGTTYLVSFRNLINGNAPQQDDQEELEVVYPFHERFLRPHRQWLDGSWQQQLLPSSASTSQQPLQVQSSSSSSSSSSIN